ncbi:MAG: penicillin acylase [Pirellulaceae bacterium]|nr:MAG: penicillin acylase [Pirellulaceae bacterium]
MAEQLVVPTLANVPFRAVRDEAGVPHIQASTFSDALFGLGYMHALDRGTQILFARSIASGRALEQIADRPELAETDLFFRRIGLHLRLEDELAALGPTTQRLLQIYSDGVNAGLRDLGRTWPMWAVGYQVCPWDVAGVLLIGRLLSFGGLVVSQMENERILLELIHAGVDQLTLRELFYPRLQDAPLDWLKEIHLANRLSNHAMELLADLPRLAGSNAWAVSPGRSATEAPVLAADPHLEINRLPAIWYEAVLQWGNDQYVMGASLPGCPLFAVGRSRYVAWGVTHMKGDLVDFFVEQCRKHNGKWQYRRGRRWHDFHVRREEILRRGGQPMELLVWESDLGPLENNPELVGEGYHLATRWTGAVLPGSGALATWLELLHARTVAEAARIVARCPLPSLCWVLADRSGRIGYQACGRFPKRREPFGGLLPQPAWETTRHWRGWIALRRLPHLTDPPEGYVASANEEVTTTDGWPLVTQPAPDYRKRRICQLLSNLTAATVDDMQRMQYDVYSLHAEEVLEEFLPHLPEGKLKETLQAWDRRFTTDSVAATWFFRLYVAVIVEMLGHAGGIGWRRTLYLCSRAGYSLMLLTGVDRLLRRSDSPWWAIRRVGLGEIVRRAAARVASENPKPWSEVNNFHFTDRFFGAHRVGRLLGFRSERHAMPGCHATLFYGHVLQTAGRELTFAPSYHFVTDLGTDEAWTNLPGGPSENRFSPWYKTDVARWLEGKYKRLSPHF